jgi:APA family basic amino acid/polyamine antiporter
MSKSIHKGQLSYRAALSVIVGSIIGAGLFMKPASMAAQLNHPIAMTLVWILAGLFTLCGTLVVAELGVMMPSTGGLFVHFSHCYGKKTGFLYGWSAFSVINTASVAAIAFICAYYIDALVQLPKLDPHIEVSVIWSIYPLGSLYPLKDFSVKILAIFLVILLTWLNTQRVQSSGRFQLISAGVNGAILLLIPILIFTSKNGSSTHFYSSASMLTAVPPITGWAAALTGAFFALDGWINIVSIAGEVNNPSKTIPRTLFLGVLICLTLYLMMNQAYLYVLPVERMAQSHVVAAEALEAARGPYAAGFVSLLIVFCTVGALNGNIMACSRITYAMGKEKVFPSFLGKRNESSGSPTAALWLHGGWISILIISGSFDMLADMYVFVTWMAYVLAALAVFRLRKTHPNLSRPYRVWAHPITTGIFILFSLSYLLVTLYNDVYLFSSGQKPVVNSAIGFLFVLTGLPLYAFYNRKNKNEPKIN